MVWVFVFAGIALAGLVLLACYALWMAHKLSDLVSEFAMVGQRVEELQDLVGQLQIAPEPPSTRASSGSVDSDRPGALTAPG